ncbi:MAG: ATP-binding protein, partial [Oscillospiraceae bacterium]|nr:ATP-binding protein [Oscillospiraceae bacterium]
GIDSAKIILYCDRDILYQIVYNLVDNAVKFVNHNGIIRLSTHSDEHNIYLWFGNTGKGISGREMPRIFDRFYKTDFSRSHDTSGVGLGLSIVKKFVGFHHGSIILQSNQDEYTEFLLTFPVDKFNVAPETESEDNAESENNQIHGENNER